MKKKLNIILSVAILTIPLVSCGEEENGCVHTFYEGICSQCGEKHANYEAAENSNPVEEDVHVHTYYEGVCSICDAVDSKYVPAEDRNPVDEQPPVVSNKHLILDAKGNYGGTLNRTKYGEGAPLNGLYDVENDEYYTVNDFYNMKSTDQRTIYTNFAPYQQTMQDSSGLACILMMLNYLGEDVSDYSEINLVKAYEQVNNATVYNNGTTPEGLANLVNSLNLGYSVTTDELDFSEAEGYEDYTDIFQPWVEQCVKDGKFVLLRYQAGNGYGWKLVIGYDNMGDYKWSYTTNYYTNMTGDDVVIFADPNDNYDHYQDGYVAARASNVGRWWFNMTNNGVINEIHEYVVIDPNIDVEFEFEAESKEPYQTVYDIHLPLNNPGEVRNNVSYGGMRDQQLYGIISTGDGLTNHTENPYYKINDFYNMGSEGSRVLLKNYTVLQQTMSSSCGVCAVNSVLKYYGNNDYSFFDMELAYTNLYDEHPGFSDVVRGGTTNINHKIALKEWGYTSHYYQAPAGGNAPFPTYRSFISFVKYNISNGRPIVIIASPKGGHFLTIIGYDSMGTDYIYDDVIIIADSSDYWDNYQDGYNIYNANQMYRQFTNGNSSVVQQALVIYKK